jgi:F-type H+-transporting ATPase subunit delta
LKDKVLARRYAGALFELAVEKGELDKLAAEVAFFDRLLAEHRDLRHFIFAQDVSKREKSETLQILMQDKVSPMFFNFLLVVLRKNRELVFPVIAEEFGRLVDRHNNKIHAVTTTATPMQEQLQQRLKEYLDEAFAADVVLNAEIDPEILGGIVVHIQGQIIDGSLKNQLQRLKQNLLENSKATTA